MQNQLIAENSLELKILTEMVNYHGYIVKSFEIGQPATKPKMERSTTNYIK